jgi:hypothetical protein
MEKMRPGNFTNQKGKTMRITISIAVFLSLLYCMTWGCGAPEIEDENLPYASKTFDREYDEVWDAVQHIMVDEMMLPIKIKDKDRGLIQSDWVSVIRLRGTMRWYVKVLLNRESNGTTVRVSHAAEVPTEVVGKMKDSKGDVKTGWQNSKENIREAHEIMTLLSNALE